jgi:predicted SAM-dependent methyltransferase
MNAIQEVAEETAMEAVRQQSGNGLRLNLGAGTTEIPGFIPIDVMQGSQAYPLIQYADGVADEIRASHILEHFSHTQTINVLKEWWRVLKPGGRIRLSVPDFDYIVARYKEGSDEPLEGYVMGGHCDEHDVHLAMFNEQKLTEALKTAGFAEIKRWSDDIEDCSSMKVSLNLEALKGADGKPASGFKVQAAMSLPRLTFTDNFFCVFQALMPLKIGLRKHTGAYWGQCLEECVMYCLGENPDAILTVDYDTLFTRWDVQTLMDLMQAHPEADAIAALQAARTKSTPLMTMKDSGGKNVGSLPRDAFKGDLLRVNTAHFGLTLIRAEKLKAMPHPWFKHEPAVDGTWSEGRTDADIWFWRQWERQGNTLYLANRVPVGHAELMVRWPDINMESMYQHPSDYWDKGKPEEVWK